MFKINNGILEKNGKKIFALGQSYYPSFHYAKYPVPPEGDRIGEMKKDLKMMAEMGFNHIRYAALGGVKEKNGEYFADTPFIDTMIEEAGRDEISVSIRMQGYAVNLRGFDNVRMIDADGVEQGKLWYDFIETTLHHEGILEDNRVFSKVLAAHYEKFPEVVALQIYNEPHYPGTKFYDYHENTIVAYRKWLVKKGLMTEAEAKSYNPPRKRKDQSERMWALWRLFSVESLTEFLANASLASKEASSLPTYTCFTGTQISNQNAYHGCDYFENAKYMDVVGFTCYFHAMGEEYFQFNLLCDMAQCSAELEGKHAWCVELDSRTYIPLELFNRNTYAMLGSGCKGLLYYQWRGDYPAEGVPFPNSCGLLNYDGTKTKNYNNAAKAVKLINEMSDLIVNADKLHEGVGILHSDYAAFMCDARENSNEQLRKAGLRNSCISEEYEIYRRLRRLGFGVSVTDAAHLDENKLGVKVLFVPRMELVSDFERASINAFVKNGGKVYYNYYEFGYAGGISFRLYPEKEMTREETVYMKAYTMEDVFYIEGMSPKVESLTPDVCAQTLIGDGYTLVVLNNVSAAKSSVNARLKVELPFTGAIVRSFDGDKMPEISGNIITVNDITDGAIIVLN